MVEIEDGYYNRKAIYINELIDWINTLDIVSIELHQEHDSETLRSISFDTGEEVEYAW